MKTLYHFCSAKHVESILKNGLTLGKCPIIYPIGRKMIKNCQWLTIDGDPAEQSWATTHLVSYDRTTFRLTIEIPSSGDYKLHKADDFIKKFPVETRRYITGWDGHENWYIFQGNIPPDWITECVRMKKEG